MKVKLTQCVAIDGTPTAPGTIVELTESECASLIRRGFAEQSEEGEPPVEGDFLNEDEQPKRKRK